jgi:hypothetical protein
MQLDVLETILGTVLGFVAFGACIASITGFIRLTTGEELTGVSMLIGGALVCAGCVWGMHRLRRWIDYQSSL